MKVEKNGLNSRIISDLCSYIDATQLIQAYQHPRKNGRLFGYSDVLRDSCSKCFYWRNGVVYVFDGRVWIPFDSEVLKYLIRDSLVSVSGVGCEVVKSDWIDCERKMFGYAMDGIRSHVLEYNGSLVGFSNGVWDFSDMLNPVRHDFRERMPVTNLLGYKYDPEAVCPVWLGFLGNMLRESDIEILQKFMALGCRDRKSLGKIEESLWLIGDGANGKTTIQNVIRMVFGEWNVSTTRLDALLDRNIDARMRAMSAIEGRLFNMCAEISGSDIERGSDVFKSLASGEPQDVRGIGRDIHTAYDIPFLVFSMNQMPSNRKMDKAFLRRMVRIDFRSSVKREDMDRSLLTKLAGELSGIRNWVLQGWRKLERDGFSVLNEKRDDRMSEEDVEMYIANGQTVDVWLDQYAFLSPSRHVGHDDDEVMLEIRSVDLYKDYCSYCEGNLMCEPVTAKSFGMQLHDRLHFEPKRKAQGVFYRVYCDKDSRFNIKNIGYGKGEQ